MYNIAGVDKYENTVDMTMIVYSYYCFIIVARDLLCEYDIRDSTDRRLISLLQTYLAEITRSTDERHLDVGRSVVIKMPRCNAGDNLRFVCLIISAQIICCFVNHASNVS